MREDWGPAPATTGNVTELRKAQKWLEKDFEYDQLQIRKQLFREVFCEI